MIQPLLSILIPTVVGREEQFKKLQKNIINQYGRDTVLGQLTGMLPREGMVSRMSFNEVETLSYRDNKEITIGEKREILYNESKGMFSWQIDDDDSVSDNAIQLILEAIKSNPEVDCITFEEHIDIDGKIQRSNHSLKYDDWHDNFDGYDYVRTPFFKSVIKTDIARSVPIPHIRFGEDHQWAQLLKPHLHSEIHIPEQLYKYIHRSTPHNERYGFDK